MDFEYDANGNLTKDGRKGLIFRYNCLDLLSEVESGGELIAEYAYLADGTKLEESDGAGNGRAYAGSLIFLKSGEGYGLEGVLFGEGMVKVGENGTTETYYYLGDHWGSVQAIVDGEGNVAERNDYYPFGAQHARNDYAQMGNCYKFNGKEEEEAGGLKLLDYGARRYDAALGRWTGTDPLADSYSPYSPYAYCLNNPVALVDPNGAFSTHYVNEDYNMLFSSNDGSDDVFMVSDDQVDEFNANVEASRWDEDRVNGEGWNSYWRSEFELADRQLSEAEIAVADMYHSRWARNNAVAYFLKPTFANAAKLGISEALSQWTDPELVVGGLSAGVSGLGNVGKLASEVQAAVKQIPISSTKSYARLSQQIHKLYRADEVKPGVRVKECTDIKGIRPDFVDYELGKIYELKPANERAMKAGRKQLEKYRQKYQQMYPEKNWTTQLDVYFVN